MALTASVVIPTYNRHSFLDLTLASFRGSDAPIREIVVVNDGGTAETEAILEKHSAALPIVALRQENRGRAAARNTGIRACTGDIIVFCDDDCLVGPSHIRHHLAAHQTGDHVVVGPTWSVTTHVWPGMALVPAAIPVLQASGVDARGVTALQPLWQSDSGNHDLEMLAIRYATRTKFSDAFDEVLQAYGRDLEKFRLTWMLCLTVNLSARRHRLEEIGRFDEGFGTLWGTEDYDLGLRLFNTGSKGKLAPETLAYHQSHPVSATKYLEATRSVEYFLRKHDRPLLSILAAHIVEGRTAAVLNRVALELEALDALGLSSLGRQLTRSYAESLAFHSALKRLG